jgi:hypothetical protein
MRVLPPDRDLHVIVHCDGASRGNPGPAGIGVQITDDDGTVLAEIARGLGVATNNQAEYTAVIEGLKRALELGATRVTVRSDSRLLVEQLSGRFRVKNPTLQRLHKEARDVRAPRAGRLRVPRGEHRADRRRTGVDAWLAAGVIRRPPPSLPLWGAGGTVTDPRAGSRSGRAARRKAKHEQAVGGVLQGSWSGSARRSRGDRNEAGGQPLDAVEPPRPRRRTTGGQGVKTDLSAGRSRRPR